MVLFFNMIDTSGVAANILYDCANPQLSKEKKQSGRKAFLKQLAKELVHNHILKRSSNGRSMKRSVKTSIEQLGYKVITDVQMPPKNCGKRSRCSTCPRNADKKTSTQYHFCNNPVCSNHFRKVCIKCLEEMNPPKEHNEETSEDISN